MKTNRPSGSWQTDKETEREERGEERQRQRGACKERNEVMKKNYGGKRGMKGESERERERRRKEKVWRREPEMQKGR